MRILVTGAAGFIGSHLIERLIADGHTVIGIDDLSTGSLEHLEGLPHGRWRLEPTTVLKGLRRLRSERVDCIYHLAARIGVGQVLADPLSMLRTDAADVLAIVDFAVSRRAKVLFTSSSEVYGARTDPPFREDQPTLIGPVQKARWAYAVGKLWAEHVLLAAHRQNALPVVVTRLFNIAGPRQRAMNGCVLPIFVTQALKGGPITVHGDGHQVRTFLPVADAVERLTALMASTSANGVVVNVGTPHHAIIGALALKVAQYVHATYDIRATIEHVPFAQLDPHAAWGEMLVRQPDVTQLQQLTGLAAPAPGIDGLIAETTAYWARRMGITARKDAA